MPRPPKKFPEWITDLYKFSESVKGDTRAPIAKDVAQQHYDDFLKTIPPPEPKPPKPDALATAIKSASRRFKKDPLKVDLAKADVAEVTKEIGKRDLMVVVEVISAGVSKNRTKRGGKKPATPATEE